MSSVVCSEMSWKVRNSEIIHNNTEKHSLTETKLRKTPQRWRRATETSVLITHLLTKRFDISWLIWKWAVVRRGDAQQQRIRENSHVYLHCYFPCGVVGRVLVPFPAVYRRRQVPLDEDPAWAFGGFGTLLKGTSPEPWHLPCYQHTQTAEVNHRFSEGSACPPSCLPALLHSSRCCCHRAPQPSVKLLLPIKQRIPLSC